MKLERLLHSQGFGSRKECRQLIQAGLVTVSGVLVEDPNHELEPDGQVFDVDGTSWTYRPAAYLMLHKPGGYECSRKPTFHPSVFALLPAPLVMRQVQTVGRLDQDTTGLLLLTDDGQFIHRWSSGKKQVQKAYRVQTQDPLEPAQLAQLLAGVNLHDEPLPIKALACEQTGSHTLVMTVTEGKYHQVKRMVAAVGHLVVALHRTRIGGLSLPVELAQGEWRWLEDSDIQALANEPLNGLVDSDLC